MERVNQLLVVRGRLLVVGCWLLLCSKFLEAKMLVRVQGTPQDVAGLDIAGCKRGEWVDVVVNADELESLKGKFVDTQAKACDYLILAPDIGELLRSLKGVYHSYAGFVDTFTQIATSHPSIAKLDTIGVSWEGRPILAMKISDNVLWDEDEPKILFDGLHHAREWPTLEICLFYADTLTKGYGIDAHITDVVNSNEIWIVPCVNPDGYTYSHDGGDEWWRKNRRPPNGVDLNRNYNGSCNGSRWGAWGSIDNGKASHDPFSEVYCGEDAFSEYETQAIRNLISAYNFTFYVSYHTYSELVMWPWGYTNWKPPDSLILSEIGYNMAQLIERQTGGPYDAFQSYDLYPTSGTSDDWVYGYSLYIQGMPTLTYVIEACDEFHPNASVLDQVVRENFDAAIYICDIADSVRDLLVPRIVPPIIAELGTVGPDYEISWSSAYPANNYELGEFNGFSVIEDGAEDSTGLWYFEGFTRNTSNPHTGAYSYFSGGQNNGTRMMTTVYPLPYCDSLIFWCQYDIQDPQDHAFVEVSTDRNEVRILGSFTGNSGGWVRKAYPLPLCKSLFLRFRYTTDYSWLDNGFYVDDIYPVPKFDSVVVLSNTITDTFYTISGKPPGIYWYSVRGYNSRGWGDFSQLEDVVITVGVEEKVSLKVQESNSLKVHPNPFTQKTVIRVHVPCSVPPWRDNSRVTIHDLAGRVVHTIPILNSQSSITEKVWDAKDLTSSIYFVTLQAGDFRKSIKVTLIR